eukprot:gene4388-5134_t
MVTGEDIKQDVKKTASDSKQYATEKYNNYAKDGEQRVREGAEKVKKDLSGAAESAKQKVSDAAESAKQKGENVASNIKEETKRVASNVKEDTKAYINQWNTRSGAIYAGLGGASGALLTSGYVLPRAAPKNVRLVALLGLATLGGYYGLNKPVNAKL